MSNSLEPVQVRCCRTWSGSRLFTKVISRRQKSLLAGKKLRGLDVGLDLGPNSLQRLSADDKGRYLREKGDWMNGVYFGHCRQLLWLPVGFNCTQTLFWRRVFSIRMIICMICQSVFSGDNTKKMPPNVSPAELAERVVNVKSRDTL